MDGVLQLQNSVSVMRKELGNLRKQLEKLKYMLNSEVLSIKRTAAANSQERSKLGTTPLHSSTALQPAESSDICKAEPPSTVSSLTKAAIGTVRTCFREKNGTPRQPGLVPGARGVIRVEVFTNPGHSLEGLEDYSHAWLLFVFHRNDRDSVRAKVKPPRMGGEKRGVFATRSPHRPCPIGLSLVQINKVQNDTLYVSGLDLVDGTPILDIKPYIPAYDSPVWHSAEKVCQCQLEGSLVRVAPWLESPPVSELEVEFSEAAERQLSLFQCQTMQADQLHSPKRPYAVSPTRHEKLFGRTGAESQDTAGDESESTETEGNGISAPHVLHMFSSVPEARGAIVGVLQQDPRSVYRREKCSWELYQFSIDELNVTCQFTGCKATVIDVQPKEQWMYRKGGGGGSGDI